MTALRLIGGVVGLGLGTLIAAAPASATTLYSNPFDPAADFGDCSFSSTCGGDFGHADDFAAQGFTIAGGSVVQSAGFTELDSTQLSGPSTIDWAFYTDAGGLPGVVMASGTASVSDQSSAGIDAGGGRYIDTYSFNTSAVALDPGSYFFALHTTSSDFFNFLATGQISSGAAESQDGGATWQITYVGIEGIAVELDGDQNPVPEPVLFPLFGAGVFLLGLIRRRV